MVISRTTAGAVTVHSLLLDQQGSIATVVADSTGTSAANESFTAYGSRREASTWTGTPTTAELNAMNGVTREGYTFQTVLGSMGLNHMNARIEDSVTGRFLSPDTKVSDRTFSQDYNRYSYVNNNPLSYTDPTGHNPFRHCTDWCTTTGTGRKVYFNRYENSFFDGDPPGFAAAGPGLGLAWANMSSSGDDDLDDLTDSLNTLAAQLINDALNFVAGNDASGLLADAIQAQDAGTAQSQSSSGCYSLCLTSAGAGTAVGEIGSALGEGLGWLAGAIGGAVSVIGGVLVPNTSITSQDQTLYTFFHGTASFSGGPLDGTAAAANSNQFGSAPGFYLASDPATAAHFAAVAAETAGTSGVVLQYQISDQAMTGLQAAGSVIGPVPGGPSRWTSFPGVQFFVPVTAFPVFNGFLATGGIAVVGGH